MPVHVSRVKCCMNNSEKFFRSQGEVSTTVNQERREHADVRLLITTHTNNQHLFDGKATNKDAFEKIAGQFTKASASSLRRGEIATMLSSV